MSHVHLARQPSSLRGKTLTLDIYTQTVQSYFFIPVVLIGTICITLPDLDLAWGSQGQCQAKPLGFVFSHIFHLIWMKFDVMMKQLKLNTLRLLFNKTSWNKRNNCSFTDCIKKNLSCWHAFRCLWINLIQTWYDDRYCCTLYFGTSPVDRDHDLR